MEQGGSTQHLAPSPLYPFSPRAPLSSPARFGRLCHLCPSAEPPASSSDLLLPPGAGSGHTWSHRLSYQVTSQPTEKLVAHMPLRAGPTRTGFLEWNFPQGSSTNYNWTGPQKVLGLRVKADLGKFLRAIPRGGGRTSTKQGMRRRGVPFPRAGQTGAPRSPSPSPSPQAGSKGLPWAPGLIAPFLAVFQPRVNTP